MQLKERQRQMFRKRSNQPRKIQLNPTRKRAKSPMILRLHNPDSVKEDIRYFLKLERQMRQIDVTKPEIMFSEEENKLIMEYLMLTDRMTKEGTDRGYFSTKSIVSLAMRKRMPSTGKDETEN